MPYSLKIAVGQHSDKGRKEINQDFHGVYIPNDHLLNSKGVVVALSDGISSSKVSQIASESTIRGFLTDYFCTSEAWSVKKSVQQVLTATNSWLYSQSKKSQYPYDMNKGYVCTLSSIIFKSTTAYLFHIGDSRVYRLRNHKLKLLTEDHRHWINDKDSYLSRAMGANPHLEIDYQTQELKEGDIFILTTDGVYEFVESSFMIKTINDYDDELDKAAKIIVDKAFEQNSDDNLTIQIIKINELPKLNTDELYQQLTKLPFPPLLEAREVFDGLEIVRTLHSSSRSHVYLATDNETKEKVVIKIPSIDLQGDPVYLERFLMEEWIAKRINNPYILKPCMTSRKKNYLYIAMEFIEGQTLTQWMKDNPDPGIATVRKIVEQIAKGLQAFHRLEMIHQDLRPENIMIDNTGTVKIIDFGAVKVAGLAEISSPLKSNHLLGTAQYTAPEYFLGQAGSSRSDLYSLAVITYQMLTGKFPYGTHVAKTRTKVAQSKLIYKSVLHDERDTPAWIDYTLKVALQVNPYKRYGELSEFIFDLQQPSKTFLNKTTPPLIERNPILFWKGVSFTLFIVILFLI